MADAYVPSFRAVIMRLPSRSALDTLSGRDLCRGRRELDTASLPSG